MPLINAAAALQICVLLSALPAQYFISQWYGTDSAQRIQITERLIIASWSSFTKSYLSLDAWADRLKLWLSKTRFELNQYFLKKVLFAQLWNLLLLSSRNWYYGEKKTKIGNNEAETHSYFAESTHVRSPKPEYIQFSVGQVIVHKRFGYSGVIVGWDVKAKAPEEWLQHKYPPAKQDLKDTPHYRILINKANGFGKSTAYIPEEEITIIMGLEVHHPDMKAYFSGYDGSKYIMQPWLKKIYPHD
ncbi:FBX21 protein, partial [Thalassarche chlororhynchos]|nr:FBX21 protein [Thalassarche chlororhynchos]